MSALVFKSTCRVLVGIWKCCVVVVVVVVVRVVELVADFSCSTSLTLPLPLPLGPPCLILSQISLTLCLGFFNQSNSSCGRADKKLVVGWPQQEAHSKSNSNTSALE